MATTTPVNLKLMGTFAAGAAAGSLIQFPIPPFASSQEFFGIFYQSTNSELTQGIVDSWVSDTLVAGWKAYPKATQVF